MIWPESAEITQEKINVIRLDDIWNKPAVHAPVLMKIDVQGYEMEVLKGATKSLKSIDTIVTETSFAELYIDQPLFRDVYSALKQSGFGFAGIVEQFTDPDSKYPLFADSIFVRRRD